MGDRRSFKQIGNTRQIVNTIKGSIQYIRESFTKKLSERGRITTKKNKVYLNPMFHFYTFRKHQKTEGLLMLLGCIDMENSKQGFSWSVDFRLRPENGIYRLFSFSAILHLFKFHNRNARTTSEIFEPILHIALMFPLLTLNW